MFHTFKSKFERYPLLADFLYALFFGLLSLGFGEIEFVIPGIEGGASDFREIPLIIGVFYIRNPFFLIVASMITSFGTAEGGSYITTFFMHIVPLLSAWGFYKILDQVSVEIIRRGLFWGFFIILYYNVFLIPVMIYSDQLVGLNAMGFMKSYKTISSSFKFEMVATALITALYLVQSETQSNLMQHRKNLEILINTRTKDLATANNKLMLLNDELVSSSEEINSMNQNLDGLVKERSKKIKDQLNQLIRYAHMNSHEVRAPLARVLGLLEIIKLEKTVSADSRIVEDLCVSGKELDEVVMSMNRLLEKEILSDKD